MAIITSIINLKGGVGKTTLTHHLGTGLTYRRKRTLLLDIDPQCNLSFLATGVEAFVDRIKSQQTPTIKTLFDNFLQQTPSSPSDLIQSRVVTSNRGFVYNHVDLVYSHLDLTTIDIRLARFKPLTPTTDHTEESEIEISKLSIIKRFLDEVENDYDYIFIDCPPNLHPVTLTAMFASDFYLIPAMPDHLSTVGITNILSRIEQLDHQFQSLCAYVGHSYRPISCAGIVFNKVDEYAGAPIRVHQRYMDQVREIEPKHVFNSYLVDGHGIADTAQKHQPVYAYRNEKRMTPKAKRQIECLDQILHEFLMRVQQEVLQ